MTLPKCEIRNRRRSRTRCRNRRCGLGRSDRRYRRRYRCRRDGRNLRGRRCWGNRRHRSRNSRWRTSRRNRRLCRDPRIRSRCRCYPSAPSVESPGLSCLEALPASRSEKLPRCAGSMHRRSEHSPLDRPELRGSNLIEKACSSYFERIEIRDGLEVRSIFSRNSNCRGGMPKRRC